MYKRQLLEWAKTNDSIIIEDDYDSELRYFGKPVPALQSLDSTDSVVYLGSFSSTLFPAIKISYMVLPPAIIGIFDQIRGRYTQTCSKAEQLTLALFMEKGFYNTGIKKLRNLYSQKLQASLLALSRYGHGKVKAVDTQSGINLIPVSYTHLDVYKRQVYNNQYCILFFKSYDFVHRLTSYHIFKFHFSIMALPSTSFWSYLTEEIVAYPSLTSFASVSSLQQSMFLGVPE